MKLPVETLVGDLIRLEPLAPSHALPMWEAAAELGEGLEQVAERIAVGVQARNEGTKLPFATILNGTNQLVGGTSLNCIDQENRRLEIGSTWIAEPWRRTGVNTEAKFLMLEFAFERLEFARVEFYVEFDNVVSRQAVLRIGATQEGVLRNFKLTPSGPTGNAVVYSVIDSEWPEVKRHLQQLRANPYRRLGIVDG